MVSAVMLVASAVAFGATNEVTSVNAVGFVRTTIPEGGWGLVSMPFVNLDHDVVAMTIPEIFTEAPDNTIVWFYQGGMWKKSEKSPWGGSDDTTSTFIRGDGLFINAPSGGGAVTYTIMGEVPDSRSGSQMSTNVLGVGYTLMGFAYPCDMPLTNSTLNASASDNDQIWYWDPALNGGQGGWAKNELSPWGGWDDPTFVFETGKGYMYKAASSIDWVEAKPYSWPK
jgi:hypothetical protein